MAVRKLGCLPCPTPEPDVSHPVDLECWESRTPGHRHIYENVRRVQFANGTERNSLEHLFLQRYREHVNDHFKEVDFPADETPIQSSYTYANSVCRHGERIPELEVKVDDFLSACEAEACRQRRKRCQKTTVLPDCPTECDPADDCVPCQVRQLKKDLRHRHSPGRWPDCKLCYRYRSQRATMKDIQDGQDKAIPVCKKADIKGKKGSVRTPPSPPASVLAILTSPVASPVGTPDSEYDIRKRDQLIKKYIPQRKLTHFECQPRGRVFFYTDDTASQGFVHQPYSFRRRQAAFTNVKRQTRANAISTYSISKLGLMFALPDHNPSLPDRHSSPPIRHWNNATILPPISVKKMDHVTYDDRFRPKKMNHVTSEEQNPPEQDQTRCSSATCSC